MTIQVPYRGIIEIVGDHDVGKTIAALQTVYPYKSTVFVDDDVKGDGTVRQMSENNIVLGDYMDLRKERAKYENTPDNVWSKIVVPTIDKVTSKKREVIIWDTWRIVYQSARGHVERNQAKYSNLVNFRGNSQIVQGLISRVARMLEVQQLSRLKDACDLLIVTHHIKDNYLNGISVGKIPESSQTFGEVCNMRMWLRRNPISKVPVILFLKRPSLPKVSKGVMKFVNIVPLKVTPTADDESVWQAINRYELKPIESRKPNENETPSNEELAVISGTLTKEQQEYAREMLKYQQASIDDLTVKVKASASPANGSVPESIPALLMKSQALGLDAEQIASINGITEEKLMDSTIDEIAEYWLEIEQYVKSGG